jgi:hypothetical protein
MFGITGSQQLLTYSLKNTAEYVDEPFISISVRRQNGGQQDYNCPRSTNGKWTLYLPRGNYYLTLEPSHPRYDVKPDDYR